MKIGRLNIESSRWPWQPIGGRYDQPNRTNYGWKPLGGMGRFGGGWNFKLGIAIGENSMVLDLIFGMIRINWSKKNEG